FLLIAPAKTSGRGVGPARPDVEIADELKREPAFGGAAEPGAREQAAVNGHGYVRGDWHLENDAVAPAVLGHVRNSVSDGILRRTDDDRLSVEDDFAGVGGRNAEKQTG